MKNRKPGDCTTTPGSTDYTPAGSRPFFGDSVGGNSVPDWYIEYSILNPLAFK